MINPEFKDLKRHVGHEIECVVYGKSIKEAQNISVECTTCNEVIRSEEKYNEDLP